MHVSYHVVCDSTRFVHELAEPDRRLKIDKIGQVHSDFPVVDLTHLRNTYTSISDHGSLTSAESKLFRVLKQSQRVYLRIGLARPWCRFPGDDETCWAQVTGVYTFPDYLNGRKFTDFDC